MWYLGRNLGGGGGLYRVQSEGVRADQGLCVHCRQQHCFQVFLDGVHKVPSL